MEFFSSLTGVVAPMRLAPKRDAPTSAPLRQTLDVAAFFDMRHLADDTENPAFILHQPAYRQARILIAAAGLGCRSGSKRATDALSACGIRCIIAPRISYTLLNDCVRANILPILLDDINLRKVFEDSETPQCALVTVNLSSQEIVRAGGQVIHFKPIHYPR